MKQILLTLAAIGAISIAVGQDFSKSYNQPKTLTLGIQQMNSVWGCRIQGQTVSIPRANYNFANDYSHLQMFDSISYSYDSWTYEEDGEVITGEGSPLNITVKGWSTRGEIHLGDECAATNLNGYYNGLEFKTWSVENTKINGLKFTFVTFEAAIQGHDAADGIDTYILTGNSLCMPLPMICDLRGLVDEADEIRLDIRRMHNPRSFNLSALVNKMKRTPKTIHIVGDRIYNEYMGRYTKLVYESDFEAKVEEPEPLMKEDEDFVVEEEFHADSITYTRILSVNTDSTKNMNSMILPFDIDAQYLTNQDAIPYTVSSLTATSIKTRKITGIIPANTPFIIKRTTNPKDTVLTITVKDVEVPATPDNLQSGYLLGSYERKLIPIGCKVIQNATFKNVNIDGIYVRPFRAIVLPSNEDYYNINKAPTNLTLVGEEEEISNQEFFDLLGNKTTQPMKGTLYINNGKKILIK